MLHCIQYPAYVLLVSCIFNSRILVWFDFVVLLTVCDTCSQCLYCCHEFCSVSAIVASRCHALPRSILHVELISELMSRAVFLNRQAAAWYRALASIIPGSERFSWNLSF